MRQNQDQFESYISNKRIFSLNSINCKSANLKIGEFLNKQNRLLTPHSKASCPIHLKQVTYSIQSKNIIQINKAYYKTSINNSPVKQAAFRKCQINQKRLKTYAFYTNPQTMAEYQTLNSRAVILRPRQVNYTNILQKQQIQQFQNYSPRRLQIITPYHLKDSRSVSNLKMAKNQVFSNQRMQYNNFNLRSPQPKYKQIKLTYIKNDIKNENERNKQDFQKEYFKSSKDVLQNFNNPSLYQLKKPKISSQIISSSPSSTQTNKGQQISIKASIKPQQSLKRSIKSLWEANQVVSILDDPQQNKIQRQKSHFGSCNQIQYQNQMEDHKHQTLRLQSFIKESTQRLQKRKNPEHNFLQTIT